MNDIPASPLTTTPAPHVADAPAHSGSKEQKLTDLQKQIDALIHQREKLKADPEHK